MGAEAPPNLHAPLLGARRPAPDVERRPRRSWRAIGARDVLIGVFWCSLVLSMIGVIAFVAYAIATDGPLEYSVAITGVDGLDPATDLKRPTLPMLSPAFNLTIYIKEFQKYACGECMGGHSTEVVVSYRGAFLGNGPVPRFCVLSMREDGVATKAWGVDVVLPRFLRNQLAQDLEHGEAVLDVMVTDPRYGGQMLACKAKIGGDRCHCEFEY